MDYEHSLLFGVFLTPSAADPERVVKLVEWCDTLGLDLVTGQDHPYQPSFLRTRSLPCRCSGEAQVARSRRGGSPAATPGCMRSLGH
ncbi:hypothetical protein OO015_03625 [Thermomicrobium sp. 4228-Ro]|uniref:hypothetical protein n=1 Tax=Thermomicrobium sp. 4228-Ro TaxID=2993937 RepID=UPI0022488DE2|nr:hypothetical protein [Thermomicrobium sp. 4228-Ro]MCX2726581.1 hypothetical protein [Thermomicrobium sp. 4228-Ro]